MTNAPILRSTALLRALTTTPVRSTAPAATPTFATTLQRAQAARTQSPSLARPAVASASFLPAAMPSSSTGAAGSIPYQGLIQAAAQKYGIDPALLAGVVKQESNFNPSARSGVGAVGLTQLMPATARGLGVSDPTDPAQSLDAGARFLSGLLKQFNGNPSLALAAYNAGPGAVEKYGGIPPYQQTQQYVPAVLGYAAQYRRIWADSAAPAAGATSAI